MFKRPGFNGRFGENVHWPDIPEHERQRVFDRFYRILGSDAAGNGPGLSIVKRIADFHAAKLTLADGEQGAGLRVSVEFSSN